jgi:hypothetical protein
VLRRTLYFVTAVIFSGIPCIASTVLCSSATGTSNVFTDQSCSPIFTTAAALNWGSSVAGSLTGPLGSNAGGLGPASDSYGGGPWPEAPGTVLNASVAGIPFTVESPDDELVRADNTEFAWNGSTWVNALLVNSTNIYFAGQFGAPSASSQLGFGDSLLGAIAPPGPNPGAPTITLTFAQALEYVAFQVSSASAPNFVAELLAFNAQGRQIGASMIDDTGGGGYCAGLGLQTPRPCNDAPLIQFFDPTASIASVELVLMNDDSGVYIDDLEVAQAPEPASWVFVACGLLFAALWAKRGQRRDRAAGAR